METTLFFASAGDERGTPQAFFDTLNTEFQFDLDAAASELNHKVPMYFGPGGVLADALTADWSGLTTFLNPPYSLAGKFIAKAVEESKKGATVVLLIPVRSDTKWWHTHLWDRSSYSANPLRTMAQPNALPNGAFRPGVSCRFVSGRLGFVLRVPDSMRAAIKEMAQTQSPKEISLATGLPKMAIARIYQDVPDDKLLASAPFPSAVVILRLSEIRA